MRIKAVEETMSKVTKDEIIKMIRLYGLDMARIQNFLTVHAPTQYFVVKTENGDIDVEIEYEVKTVSLNATGMVQNELAKQGEF